MPYRKHKHPRNSQEETAGSPVLSGWKQIANYLQKGVRTVQRYEREMGLPIHRPAGSQSAVVANKAELDDWLITGSGRVDSIAMRALNSRTNTLRADFLQIDSEIALTFSSIALRASDQDTRIRTTKTARRAYDTILWLREDTYLTDAASDKLDANMRRLRNELQSLGQSF
jgi:hypothetical protein